MKTCVIAYSMTGNNKMLGQAIAEALNVDFIEIEEKNERSNATIAFDMLLGRTPKVAPDVNVLDQYNQIILMGPIWMANPAAPLRAYMKKLKREDKKYAFVTISGGALNKNPKFEKNLKKKAGHGLVFFKDLYISDLMKKDNIDMKDTGTYKLTEHDVENLVFDLVPDLKNIYNI